MSVTHQRVSPSIIIYEYYSIIVYYYYITVSYINVTQIAFNFNFNVV